MDGAGLNLLSRLEARFSIFPTPESLAALTRFMSTWTEGRGSTRLAVAAENMCETCELRWGFVGMQPVLTQVATDGCARYDATRITLRCPTPGEKACLNGGR